MILNRTKQTAQFELMSLIDIGLVPILTLSQITIPLLITAPILFNLLIFNNN